MPHRAAFPSPGREAGPRPGMDNSWPCCTSVCGLGGGGQQLVLLAAQAGWPCSSSPRPQLLEEGGQDWRRHRHGSLSHWTLAPGWKGLPSFLAGSQFWELSQAARAHHSGSGTDGRAPAGTRASGKVPGATARAAAVCHSCATEGRNPRHPLSFCRCPTRRKELLTRGWA